MEHKVVGWTKDYNPIIQGFSEHDRYLPFIDLMNKEYEINSLDLSDPTTVLKVEIGFLKDTFKIKYKSYEEEINRLNDSLVSCKAQLYTANKEIDDLTNVLFSRTLFGKIKRLFKWWI